jgi:hypothetical protein
MNENELIDTLNSLRAQNMALMHGMATLICNLPMDRAPMRKEYDAMCATFQVTMLERHAPETLSAQRREFERIGSILFGI